MIKKKTTADWLEGKSWHRIRNEMLLSPAWKAASHLQQAMVFALLGELGRHSGKENGHLVFTNRNLREFGFSFDAIKPNLIALRALGFISYKAGRPGLKGYGKARRHRLTFLPILDGDGNEVEPPTDEWARFTTTEQAKAAVRQALKAPPSRQNRSRNRITSVVIQKSDHLARKYNHESSEEMPVNIGLAESEIGSLSTSMVATGAVAGGCAELGQETPVPRRGGTKRRSEERRASEPDRACAGHGGKALARSSRAGDGASLWG
jgi:hypothetical protein